MLQFLQGVLQGCPDTTGVKEVTILSTWLKDSPLQAYNHMALEFIYTKYTLPLSFVCIESQDTFIFLCRSLSVILDSQQLVQINLDLMKVRAEYIDVTLKLREGPILVTIARFHRLTCIPEALRTILSRIQVQHLNTTTRLQALYFAPPPGINTSNCSANSNPGISEAQHFNLHSLDNSVTYYRFVTATIFIGPQAVSLPLRHMSILASTGMSARLKLPDLAQVSVPWAITQLKALHSPGAAVLVSRSVCVHIRPDSVHPF